MIDLFILTFLLTAGGNAQLNMMQMTLPVDEEEQHLEEEELMKINKEGRHATKFSDKR